MSYKFFRGAGLGVEGRAEIHLPRPVEKDSAVKFLVLNPQNKSECVLYLDREDLETLCDLVNLTLDRYPAEKKA